MNKFTLKNIFDINLLVSLGLLLGTVTQFKLFGPVGVSELLFLMIFGFFLIRIISKLSNQNAQYEIPENSSGLILMFLLFFLFLGSFATVLNGIPSHNIDGKFYEVSTSIHNLIAFEYLTFILLIVTFDSEIEIRKVVLVFILGFSMLTLIFLVILLFTNEFVGLELMYKWTSRVQLFTRSPNHLADFLAPVPFLLTYFYKINRIKFKSWIIFVTGVIFAGFLTGSNSLILAWLISISFIAIILFYKSYKVKVLITTSSLLLVLLAFFYVDLISFFLSSFFTTEKITRINNLLALDFNIRSNLFLNSFNAVNQSPIIGNGFGASTGILDANLGREAHNHFGDVVLFSGYLGLIAYTLTIFFVLFKTVQANSLWLTLGLITILITTLFHTQLRQPLFWIYLIFILNESIMRLKIEHK